LIEFWFFDFVVYQLSVSGYRLAVSGCFACRSLSFSCEELTEHVVLEISLQYLSAAGSCNRILTMGNLNKFFLQLLSVAGSCNRIWMMGNSVHDTPFPSSREEIFRGGWWE